MRKCAGDDYERVYVFSTLDESLNSDDRCWAVRDKLVAQSGPNWQRDHSDGHVRAFAGEVKPAQETAGAGRVLPHPLLFKGGRSEFGCYKDACAQGYLTENSRNILDFAHPGNFFELLRNDYGVSGFHGF